MRWKSNNEFVSSLFLRGVLFFIAPDFMVDDFFPVQWISDSNWSLQQWDLFICSFNFKHLYLCLCDCLSRTWLSVNFLHIEFETRHFFKPTSSSTLLSQNLISKWFVTMFAIIFNHTKFYDHSIKPLLSN
jgi:hypothetical protein